MTPEEEEEEGGGGGEVEEDSKSAMKLAKVPHEEKREEREEAEPRSASAKARSATLIAGGGGGKELNILGGRGSGVGIKVSHKINPWSKRRREGRGVPAMGKVEVKRGKGGESQGQGQPREKLLARQAGNLSLTRDGHHNRTIFVVQEVANIPSPRSLLVPSPLPTHQLVCPNEERGATIQVFWNVGKVRIHSHLVQASFISPAPSRL